MGSLCLPFIMSLYQYCYAIHLPFWIEQGSSHCRRPRDSIRPGTRNVSLRPVPQLSKLRIGRHIAKRDGGQTTEEGLVRKIQVGWCIAVLVIQATTLALFADAERRLSNLSTSTSGPSSMPIERSRKAWKAPSEGKPRAATASPAGNDLPTRSISSLCREWRTAHFSSADDNFLI